MAEEEEETSVETSLDELARKAEATDSDDDDDAVIEIDAGDDKTEALIEKVVPIQANEFTCRSCFLVKHRSQLADKKRLYCVDCA